MPTTLGAVLASVGVVVALGAGGVLAIAGDDGKIGTGSPHQISTPTAALVTDNADFDGVSDVASAFGDPEIGVTAEAEDGGTDKFVGIGHAEDVDRYLKGVEVDRVTDIEIDPFKLDKQHRPGNATATRPGDQSFWVAQSTGQKADVDWKVRDGEYKIVVMNADGSQNVAADAHFEAGLPYLSTYALAILLSGLVAIGAGIVLIARNANL